MLDFYAYSVGAHQQLSHSDLLLIKFQVRDRVIYAHNDDSVHDEPQSINGPIQRTQIISIPRQQILNKTETSTIISNTITHFNVPPKIHSPWVRDIYSTIIESYKSQGRTTGILVELIMGTGEDYEDTDELTRQVLDLKDGKGRRITKFEAASESVVESLHKIKWSSDLKERCAICLKDFSADSVINVMKCSHFYHEECIIKWLKKTDLCPCFSSKNA